MKGPDADHAVRELHPEPPARVVRGRNLAGLVREMLHLLGEDPDRPGLERTPERVAESLSYLTEGYAATPADVVGDAVFDEPADGPIVIRDIEFYSICEHHLLPFFGKVHVTYEPRGRIIGLSKVPRLVDLFAHRLQLQERLTAQVADALVEVVAPAGAGVIIEASHLCVMMRGVEKHRSATVTSAARGVLAADAARREAFERAVFRTG